MTQPLPPHDHKDEPSAPQGASVRVLSWGQRAFLAPLHIYRRFLSPLKPQPTCRFYPSCSQYAVQAVEHHGVLRGSYLALVRLLKCHPFHPGGVDLVPGTTDLRTHEATPEKSTSSTLSGATLSDSQPTHLDTRTDRPAHLKTPVRGATPTEES